MKHKQTLKNIHMTVEDWKDLHFTISNFKRRLKIRHGMEGIMNADDLLNLLIFGGKIISSNDCTPEEIAMAQAEKHMYVNKDGYGFILQRHPALGGNSNE